MPKLENARACVEVDATTERRRQCPNAGVLPIPRQTAGGDESGLAQLESHGRGRRAVFSDDTGLTTDGAPAPLYLSDQNTIIMVANMEPVEPPVTMRIDGNIVALDASEATIHCPCGPDPMTCNALPGPSTVGLLLTLEPYDVIGLAIPRNQDLNNRATDLAG